jgi:ferredoxin-2, mitochondrial
MKNITFIQNGQLTVVDADPAADHSLLEVAQLADMPLEGTCEGQMACSTCHVIIAAEHFDLLPRASDAEEDMLDLASGATRTSRLSCQIRIADCPDGLIVKIPAESRNMQGQ